MIRKTLALLAATVVALVLLPTASASAADESRFTIQPVRPAVPVPCATFIPDNNKWGPIVVNPDTAKRVKAAAPKWGAKVTKVVKTKKGLKVSGTWKTPRVKTPNGAWQFAPVQPPRLVVVRPICW